MAPHTLTLFWEAARQLGPDVEDESRLAGAGRGDRGELFQAAGLHQIEESALLVNVEHPTFEEWWEPFLLGVGPARRLRDATRLRAAGSVRDLCRELLPAAPFVVSARAWAARGLAP